MKKSLTKILKRNIVANIKQFLAIIVIVFLSVTLLSGFLVNSNTLENSIDNYFKTTNIADMWLYVDGVNDKDEEFFDSLEINYVKRLKFDTITKIKGGKKEENSSVFVYDKVVKNSTPSIPYIVYELSGLTYEGCWVDQNYAKENNLIIGQDRIVFEYKIDEGNIVDIEFLITGTMCLCESADSSAYSPILIDKKIFLNKINNAINLINSSVMSNITLQNIDDISYNQILIKSANLPQIEQKIREYYNKSTQNLHFLQKQESVESVVLLKSEVKQSKQMIYIFPVIFLIVSVLVIMTSISQLILQERTKIGILKSIGLNNKTLLNHYASYGLVLCIIGACAGSIVGPVLISEIMFLKYDLLYSIPKDFVILSYPFSLMLSIIILIGLMGYFTSYFVCKKIINQPPISCFKPNIIKNLKSKNKKHHSNLSLPVKIAIRNIKLNPIRTIMAIIGISGCCALLICGFGIGDTLNNSVDNDLGGLLQYDVTSTYEGRDITEKLKNIDGIGNFETYSTFFAEVRKENIVKEFNVYQIKENSQFLKLGLQVNDVAISQSLAEKIGVCVDDEIIITLAGVSKHVKITKIEQTAIFNAVFACVDFEFNDQYLINGLWIDSESGFESDIVSNLNKINGTKDAKLMSDIKTNIENKISSISVITTTLKIFALALAIVVLINFINLIFNERVKEIATLKVVGQNIYKISLSICIETCFIGLIGMFIGMILGYPLLLLVLSANRVDMLNYLYHISPLSFLYSTLIVGGILFITSLICIFKTKKIKMVESLKSIE